MPMALAGPRGENPLVRLDKSCEVSERMSTMGLSPAPMVYSVPSRKSAAASVVNKKRPQPRRYKRSLTSSSTAFRSAGEVRGAAARASAIIWLASQPLRPVTPSITASRKALLSRVRTTYWSSPWPVLSWSMATVVVSIASSAQQSCEFGVRMKEIPLPVVGAEPIECLSPCLPCLNEIGQGLVGIIHGLQVGRQILAKVLERRISPVTHPVDDGARCLVQPGMCDGLELLGHLVKFALKVDHRPYPIRLPVAARLHWWRLRGGIKLEHFQVKIVDIGGPQSVAARDPMSIGQSAAIDDGDPPGGGLVEDIVGPQVQEHITGLEVRRLQVEELLMDGKRWRTLWLHEREEGEQVLTHPDGHAGETGLELTHERNAHGAFFDDDPVGLFQRFPKVGVVIRAFRVAHDGYHRREGVTDLLVGLQHAVRTRLNPGVLAATHGLWCRPFQDHLPARVALDSSPGFIISPDA